jgi:hypothetical protein
MTIEFASYFTGAVELGGGGGAKRIFFAPLFFFEKIFILGQKKEKTLFFRYTKLHHVYMYGPQTIQVTEAVA